MELILKCDNVTELKEMLHVIVSNEKHLEDDYLSVDELKSDIKSSLKSSDKTSNK